jgi:NADPH:quinone reductase-like Zn-dependent oxidoreductase
MTRAASSAVVATAFGGPEVLALIDVDAGDPGPGEVLIEVRAAGVNPFDVKRYSGAFGSDPAQLPMRLGFEVSGVVLALGDENAAGPAGAVSVGDEVIAFRIDGGYAQRVVVPASAVLPKPAALSWEQASGLMLTGATAVHALTAIGLTGGETVLIHAAAGGVGAAAVQIAVARGARVIGTAGPGRHEFLRGLGAQPVSYGEGLAERVRALAPAGVDAAIDAVGTDEAVDVSVELVADRSRIATIAAFGRGAELGLRVLGAGPGADPGTAIRDAARLELVDLVAAGALKVSVGRTFPLAEAAAAHRAILAGHTRGKLALIP